MTLTFDLLQIGENVLIAFVTTLVIFGLPLVLYYSTWLASLIKILFNERKEKGDDTHDEHTG